MNHLKRLSLFYCFLTILSATTKLNAQQQITAEDYVKVTANGAWCWFSDPRIVFEDDTYYGGYVDSEGSIFAFSYSTETQQTKTCCLYDKLNKDDHANPSIAVLNDKRLIMFFSGHGGMKNTPIYYCISSKPKDITQWGPLQSINPNVEGPRGSCYSNPAMLQDEKNRMYLFFRGADFKPNFIYSDDLKNWEQAKPLIKDATVDDKISMVRPYVKVSTNNTDRIHFAFTDGHPRNEYQNSIYYVCYHKGEFKTAKGGKIGDMNTIPFAPRDCDVVYDAKKTNRRAWIWDVAYDKNNSPVIVYARFESELKHSYWYACWNGERWINNKIADAGRWFPRAEEPKEKAESEPHYSGGVYIDHNNPKNVYVSCPVNDKYEIFRYSTQNSGAKWTIDTITQNSECDNVRPIVAKDDPNSKVFWMYNYKYLHFTDYKTAVRTNDISKGFSASFDKQSLKNVMKAVADWQISNIEKNRKSGHDHAELAWTNATLYLGMSHWMGIADKDVYHKWLNRLGSRNYWQLAPRMYHADDICIAQTYLEMYKSTGNEKIIRSTRARADWVIANASKSSLELDYGKPETLERWSWCDALFMAPPVYAQLYAISQDSKYLKFMDEEFKATCDYLFDKEEQLFYRDRRYFDKREANGEKVFWGRGNGWVIGGLVNMLKTLPTDTQERKFYEDLFVTMCKRIAPLQDDKGFWHASLLDPKSYPSPETSATGFIVYAIAYGINSGLLDKKDYYPVLEKGWEALVSAVNTEGKLGWVQPVGADPKKVTRQMTEVYGAGAFLMAGTEIYNLIK
ncbi:MAG: glycoside hydrolase family 88 protein [Bacteroidales bacterium]